MKRSWRIALRLALDLHITSNQLPPHHLAFDGTGDSITIPAAASINNLPAGNFTLELVCTVGSLLGSSATFFVKEATDYHSSGIANDTQLAFVISFGTNAFEVSRRVNNYLPATGNHHLAFVFEASPRAARIYIDGTEGTYSSPVTDVGGTYGGDSAGDMTLFSNFVGRCSWLRISNVARYTANFIAPSLTSAPASDGSTAVLYDFVEINPGSTATDLSGNGNHGTIAGATWVAD